jgi:hypothetical protein
MMMLGDRRDHNNQQHPSETAPDENEIPSNEDEFPF